MIHRKLRHLMKILLYMTIAITFILLGNFDSGILAAGPPASFPGGKRGQEAIARLGERLPDVALRYGLSAAKLRATFLSNTDLYIDPLDKLVYFCGFGLSEGSTLENDSVNPPLNASYPYDQTFQLHSRPGASKVIYLDFNGHITSGTYWNDNFGNNIVSVPYDIDGNPSSFSNTELERIQYIWERVVEDFSMYNVDVTTEDPGVEALRWGGLGDEYYGIRVVISPSSDWFGSGGGVAYVGSFNWTTDTPTFVFSNKLGNGDEKYVSEAISHEAGHTLGLYHDGKTDGTEYYAGHGDWAPIMGVGYYKPITQWSKGEYAGANNTEDDLTIMLNYGASYRTDDHGNDINNVTSLTGTNLSGFGIVEENMDVDLFSFQTGEGEITINVDPAPRDVNLDIKLQLLDSNGNVVQEKDEHLASAESMTVNVPSAGTYYILIDGVGTGDPDTGYSDYASLGQYFISGTVIEVGNCTLDSDGDGVLDCEDGCPNDYLKTAPGLCGCGSPDTDSDSDGTVDCNDGCPNDPNKTEPALCGCGEADTDSDGDGIPDCQDFCDNDGTCDAGEDCNNCSDCIGGIGGGTPEACWKYDGICHPKKEDSECADCSPGFCCGDGFCDVGENSTNCAIDCGSSLCGNGTCDAGEDQCSCPQDCGNPPAYEIPYLTCSDGLDNDCNNGADCNDSDCNTDPACAPCFPKGADCGSKSDCCSNKCVRGTCK